MAFFPNVKVRVFEPMGVHVSFPSLSGKRLSGAALFFNDNGYITDRNWQYRSERGLERIIGCRIRNKILGALYVNMPVLD